MEMKHSGTFEELKAALSDIGGKGKWVELNPNQFQFRHNNGGILNWFLTTGTVSFQGKSPGRDELEKEVSSILLGTSNKDRTAASGSPKTARDEKSNGAEKVIEAATPTRNPNVEDSRFALGRPCTDSELVLGLVGAVGTDLRKVTEALNARLRIFGYETLEIGVSEEIIPTVVAIGEKEFPGEYERITAFMDAGNEARLRSQENSILALGVAALISAKRTKDVNGNPEPAGRKAYIVRSLKHPEEVARLREIYPEGFYLIGIHSDTNRRHKYLTEDKRLNADQATELMERDEDEHLPYGQKTTDTFHMSDFFVRLDGNDDHLKHALWRILDILFSHPYKTPTFDEYAMFMAFSASLRSGDLSRQVGAVIARDDEIIAAGANDCPRAGGGLYWPVLEKESGVVFQIKFPENGSDRSE